MMSKWRIALLALIGIFLVVGATYFFLSPNNTQNIVIISKPQGNVSGNITSVAHIFVIMEENKPSSLIFDNTSVAPYINSLIDTYGFATNYSAVTHPSLPNYLAITSGSTDGVSTDCNPPSAGCIVSVKNIADEIQKSGRTWKEYAESMPSPCYAFNSGNYATKHNPFLYYADIINNKSRCESHVVPFHNLSNDLKSVSTTPNYAFITPNLCNDMHNCSIEVGDYWLSKTVPMILNSKAFTSEPSLLIITWDEGNSSNNQVATIVAGSAAKKHYKSNVAYSHYSVLSTIEASWGLKPLTQNDQQATPMTNFIR